MEVVVVSFACLFEILSIIFCLHYLYGEKMSMDLPTVCLVIFDVLWMNVINYFELDRVWTLVIYPVAMVYCGLKFEFKWRSVIINNILSIAIVGILQATIMLLMRVLIKTIILKSIDNCIINILLFAFIVIGSKKNRLKNLSDVLQGNERLVLASLAVGITGILLFWINYKHNRGFEVLYYVVLGISLILIVIAVIDIGKHKIKAKQAEAELHLHKLYEASFQKLIEDICIKQHEFDNHINTIYSQHFLYKTYDELVTAQRKYCAEVVNENHYNRLLSKGNPVILSFLYSTFLEIEKSGIRVKYSVNIGELESRVPVYKMVELLGNLIKNAVDAVQKRGRDEIYVMMSEGDKEIKIEVSNESEIIGYDKIQDFFKKGYSEKGRNRGYGLYNLKKICEQYDIKITCMNQDIKGTNWLVFNLVINKPL